jgi:hypothetical protein
MNTRPRTLWHSFPCSRSAWRCPRIFAQHLCRDRNGPENFEGNPAVNIARRKNASGAGEIGCGLGRCGEYASQCANTRGAVDGSVLNVGSDSSVHVVKHNSGAQRTWKWDSGKCARAEDFKPAGKFEVHTPAGVAGVVGTDFMSPMKTTL